MMSFVSILGKSEKGQGKNNLIKSKKALRLIRKNACYSNSKIRLYISCSHFITIPIIVGYELRTMLHFMTVITATVNSFKCIANYVCYNHLMDAYDN